MVPAQLKQYGEIISDVFEESVSRKFPGVLTGMCNFVFCVKDRARFDAGVPHLLCLVFDGVQYRLFVVVSGRKPMCLRCNGLGHQSRECPETDFCRGCRLFGHLVGKWPRAIRSYANWVTGGGGFGSLWCCGGEYGDLE